MICTEPFSRSADYLTDRECFPGSTTDFMSAQAVLSAAPRPRQALRYGELIVTIEGTPPGWFQPTLDSLAKLLLLREDWDTYGAPPIDRAIVPAALQLAVDAFCDNTPAPAVVPTSSGGVQYEWHTRGIDFEIEFCSPSRMRLYYEKTGAPAFEREVTHDFTELAGAIASLSL